MQKNNEKKMEEWIEKKAVEFLWKNENYILHNLNEMKYNH